MFAVWRSTRGKNVSSFALVGSRYFGFGLAASDITDVSVSPNQCSRSTVPSVGAALCFLSGQTNRRVDQVVCIGDLCFVSCVFGGFRAVLDKQLIRHYVAAGTR